MKRWHQTLIGGILVGAGGAYWSLPHLVEWQVEKRYPGVRVGRVEVQRGGCTLHNVIFDRGWVSGTLTRVDTNWDGTQVDIAGGSIEVDLNAKPKGGTGETRRDIQASGLTVRVKKDDYRALVTGARTEENLVCFDKATLEKPDVVAENGCVSRDGEKLTAQSVVAAPLEIKGVKIGKVTASGIEAKLKAKTVDAEKIETTVTFEGQTLPVEATGVKANPDDKTPLRLATLKTKHEWLAPDWTTAENVTITRDKGWVVSVGESQIKVDPETMTFEGAETCATWVKALPKSLQTKPLDKIQWSGDASFRVQLRPKSSFSLKATCKAVCKTVPNLRVAFRYTAYTAKREPFERTTGPNTREWLPLSMTGEMPLAVTNMEDPGFPHHRGFISQAFANSLTDNLRQGRFVRGGSTITMQLAKNLWLTREKNLGRKAQEFFLAQALESCYSKDEILELYLNVVEFGPDKYGVGAGAHHWFNRSPSDLTPTEAFWMAGILPRPTRVGPPDEAALKRTEKLMKTLAESGRIPDLVVDTAAVEAEGSNWETEP